jgi:esterase
VAGIARVGTQLPVSISGVELRYDERGQGTPVLLVHGTAANLWGDVFARLAEQHRVIAYDRRSFGRSIHPPLGEPHRHTEDAAALLEQLDAVPAVVVGWSLGGIVALDLALRSPELVAGLVLVEPPLHAKRRPRPAMLRAIIGAQLAGRLGREQAGAERFLRWALRDRDGSNALDRLPEDWRTAMLDNAAAIVGELAGGTGEQLKAEQLRSISCPALCLVGGNSDPAFRHACRRIAGLLPRCELRIVSDSGHVMQFDRPDEIVHAVQEIAQARS